MSRYLDRLRINIDGMIDDFLKEIKERDLKGSLDELLWSFIITRL